MEDEIYYPEAFVDPWLHDPYIMGIVGNIGSGKTVLVSKLIRMWRFKFDIVVWISPTYPFQDMKLMPEDSTGIVVFDKLSKENVEMIKLHQETRNKRLIDEGKPPSRMLLILDDNGTRTRKLLEGGMLDDLLIHYKINVVQLAQRYTQLSPSL